MGTRLVALGGLILLAACGGGEMKLSEEYPGPWRSALDNPDILRTMATNHVACDDKQYKLLGGAEVEAMFRDLHAGTYLVACLEGSQARLYEVETRPADYDSGGIKSVAPADKWPKDLDRPKFLTNQ